MTPVKVSVVMPVFNISSYLVRSIESVLSQTLREIELIIVNDGSTDKSGDIISEYAVKDQRIIVINKKNQGLAAARQDGISRARGEYIQNLDGDDFLEREALEILYNKARDKECDLVVMDFWNYNDETGRRENAHRESQDCANPAEYLREMFYERGYWASWTYLFRRNLYFSAPMVVPHAIAQGEDAIFTTQLFLRARSFVKVDKPLINYVLRSRSISSRQSISEVQYRNFCEYPRVVAELINKSEYKDLLAEGARLVDFRAKVSLLSYGYIDYAADLCKILSAEIKRNKEFIFYMPRRIKKIVNAYHFSQICGYLLIRYYSFRGKI